MLNFKCYICKKELTEPGALLFSPPELIDNGEEKFYTDMVEKRHICRECYNDLIGWVLVGQI